MILYFDISYSILKFARANVLRKLLSCKIRFYNIVIFIYYLSVYIYAQCYKPGKSLNRARRQKPETGVEKNRSGLPLPSRSTFTQIFVVNMKLDCYPMSPNQNVPIVRQASMHKAMTNSLYPQSLLLVSAGLYAS